jgi:hypothetical protein
MSNLLIRCFRRLAENQGFRLYIGLHSKQLACSARVLAELSNGPKSRKNGAVSPHGLLRGGAAAAAAKRDCHFEFKFNSRESLLVSESRMLFYQ